MVTLLVCSAAPLSAEPAPAGSGGAEGTAGPLPEVPLLAPPVPVSACGKLRCWEGSGHMHALCVEGSFTCVHARTHTTHTSTHTSTHTHRKHTHTSTHTHKYTHTHTHTPQHLCSKCLSMWSWLEYSVCV